MLREENRSGRFWSGHGGNRQGPHGNRGGYRAHYMTGCRLDGPVPNKRPKCTLFRRLHASIPSAGGSEKVQVQETPSS